MILTLDHPKRLTAIQKDYLSETNFISYSVMVTKIPREIFAFITLNP
jgi:hypothetical protein